MHLHGIDDHGHTAGLLLMLSSSIQPSNRPYLCCRDKCRILADATAIHYLLLQYKDPDWFYLPGFTFLVGLPAQPGSPGQSPGSCKTVVVVHHFMGTHVDQ